jgi:magnesium transporter
MGSDDEPTPGAAAGRRPFWPVPSLPRRKRAAPDDVDEADHERDRRSAIVDCALYQDGVRKGGQLPLETALDSAREVSDGFVWIGLYEPTHAEFEAVAAAFDLHPLAVEDAVHAHQRPKLEIYGDIAFLVLKTVRYVDPEEVIEVGELMLFTGSNFVITVRHGTASPLSDVRRNLEANPDLLAAGPAAVLYAVADRVVDGYGEAARGVSNDVSEIELQVFSGDRAQPTERLYKLEREVLEFRGAVRPLADPLDSIVNGDVRLFDPHARTYFRDVHDHVLRVADQIDEFNELLSGALTANLAQIQVRQNEDMRRITAWAAIFAVNTLIAGIYGMNFIHMPELSWKFGYPIILTIMLGVSAVLYRGFKRSRWI